MFAPGTANRTEWKVGATILALGLVGIVIWQVSSHETPAELQARILQEDSKSEQLAALGSAFLNCSNAIKAASVDPQNTKVPSVDPMQGGADFRFSWPTAQPVRLRNSLGQEVTAEALCVVDEKTGRIKLLTLDGKRL